MALSQQEVLEKLSGALKGKRSPAERARFVLPLLLLARLDSELGNSRVKLRGEIETGRLQVKELEEGKKRQTLARAFGITKRPYFSTGRYTLSETTDPAGHQDRFVDLLNGFSKRVRENLQALGLVEKAKDLAKTGQLLATLSALVQVQESNAGMTDDAFGNLLRGLLQLLTEATNENAADCATAADLVELAAKLLVHHGGAEDAQVRTVYDPACGTGGLLLEAGRRVLIRHGGLVKLRGHEDKTEMHAIADLYLLLRTSDIFKGSVAAILPDDPPTLIWEGNTLRDPGRLMSADVDYAVCNPPMGKAGKWGGKEHEDLEKAIRKERTGNPTGRFGPGLPSGEDSSLLFMMHILAKLRATGRAVMFMNASPLFEGEVCSTENAQAIRLWLLEKDWLDAVISLPENVHFNTNIVTYLWVLDKNKPSERKRKVVLINAAREDKDGEPIYASKLPKNQNQKRYTVESRIPAILDMYGDAIKLAASEDVRVIERDDLKYHVIKLRRPWCLRISVTDERLAAFTSDPAVAKVFEGKKPGLVQVLVAGLRQVGEEGVDANAFLKEYQDALSEYQESVRKPLPKPIRKALLGHLAVRDPTASPLLDEDGNQEPDPDWEDTEQVPWNKPIEEYLDEEVRPYLDHPVWYETGTVRDGCEINFNRFFYRYQPPRALDIIEAELEAARDKVDRLFAELDDAEEEPELPRPAEGRILIQGTLFGPRLYDDPEDVGPDALPVYDLKAAAGAFSTGQDPEPLGWTAVDGVKRGYGRFIAQVVGESMNRVVQNGEWCLWEHFGAYGVGGPTTGDNVIVRRADEWNDEFGYFTFKRVQDRGGRVRLVPVSHDLTFKAIDLESSDRFIARLVKPIGWGNAR